MLAWSGSLGSLEIRQRLGHGSGIVVRTMRGTTQHQMAVGIALGLRGNHTTIQIDGEEMMLESGRETRIGRRLDGTIRSVLETDRHGHAGRQLAVHLAFRITRANSAPADQIANILRGNRIKPFRSGGQAEPQHVGKHLASHEHALANIELAVKIRIVDQTLPTDRGARLLEIHAHDDDQTIIKLLLDGGKPLRILVRSLRIMNRTRADDGQQTIVTAMQHVTNLLTGLQHQIAHLVRERKFLKKISGSGNRVKLTNIDIHGLRKHGALIQQLCILRTIRTAKTCHRFCSSPASLCLRSAIAPPSLP